MRKSHFKYLWLIIMHIYKSGLFRTQINLKSVKMIPYIFRLLREFTVIPEAILSVAQYTIANIYTQSITSI